MFLPTSHVAPSVTTLATNANECSDVTRHDVLSVAQRKPRARLLIAALLKYLSFVLLLYIFLPPTSLNNIKHSDTFTTTSHTTSEQTKPPHNHNNGLRPQGYGRQFVYLDTSLSSTILTTFTELSDKMTPQGSKSTPDKIGEGISNVGDKFQR